MSAADAVAAVMFLAIVMYAVFGGADFGSGIWDLTAGDTTKGSRTRRLIDHAIGPVWEANHVWLIFVLVFLWSGFPSAFTTLMTDLAIPFWLAALGIVARGAAFAFRKYAPTLRLAQLSGIIFAVSSLVTPFFFGAIAGAVASGKTVSDGAWPAWLETTSILGGLLAVSTCTFLAGVLLTAEADRLGDQDLADELAAKSLIGGIATGMIALTGFPILLTNDQVLVDGLLGQALPIAILSGLSAFATIYLLREQRYSAARVSAAAAVGLVTVGWGVAQYPWIIVDQISIDQAAGAQATLIGLLIAAAIAAVLIVPPLLYLFALADGRAHADTANKG